QTAETIYKEQSLVNVEDRIAPLEEVFRIQAADELQSAEKIYLTGSGQNASAIVLAASQGEGLESLTQNMPKCMIPFAGKSILEHLTGQLKKVHVNRISVVVGYKPESVKVSGIKLIENRDFDTTKELSSLALAEAEIKGTNLIVYGDVLMRQYVLEELLNAPEDIVIAVDSAGHVKSGVVIAEDRVKCSAADSWESFNQNPQVVKFWPEPDETCHGQWAGVLKVSETGGFQLKQAMNQLRKTGAFTGMNIPQLLNQVLQNGFPVHALYIRDHCVNVNQVLDVGKAQTFLTGV
ncbi:MAG: NTP transferase domain-containing protein, partial [Planctomycetaceae bacterium]|nr:NTP transferase domain-containing protein [Planctomycetaceae bacterium]